MFDESARCEASNYAIVIPTIGRPSLRILIASLEVALGPAPQQIVIVDDRPNRAHPLELPRSPASELANKIEIVSGFAAGPASARNRGWRRTRAPWVAFLDDDVVVGASWPQEVVRDIESCDSGVGATQGKVYVPLDETRAPTDWERNVRALEGAPYITADLAVRRTILQQIGGFDERFPRAYREDADFALRLMAAGWTIGMGRRFVNHPVRSADRWISVRLQAGNADDALMEALHGRDWYERAGSPRGTFREHVATVIVSSAALCFGLISAYRMLHLAWRRIAPGPRDTREIATMLLSSVALPFAAVFHRLYGKWATRGLLQRPARRAAAVLFDRDGTLVQNNPELRDPRDIRLVDGAIEALRRLREADVACAIVTNQSRVGEGRLAERELIALHDRLDAIAGPFDAIEACIHARDADCACRKPAPGLVFAAARRVGVEPHECVVVGDIGSDLDAAYAAGARAVLVPTSATRRAEVRRAPVVARDLEAAVDMILSGAV